MLQETLRSLRKRKIKFLATTAVMAIIGIDGKFVYVHKADIDVIPAGLFDN